MTPGRVGIIIGILMFLGIIAARVWLEASHRCVQSHPEQLTDCYETGIGMTCTTKIVQECDLWVPK